MNQQSADSPASGLDILIVDDDRGTARTTALILERKGCSVQTAESGPEALEIVGQKPFDLIFLDIKMPVMNGVETHQKIKELRPQAMVVMMTAYAVEELVDQALDDGAHDILYKPLDFERVLDIVEEARTTQRGGLVMVVDDNPAIRGALQQTLTEAGHSVVTAESGEEALDAVREEDPDIVFIDLKLPRINGLETYLSMKEIKPEVVAVIMTGYPKEMADLAQEAIERDAYACLQKPFDVEDVLELTREVWRRKVGQELEPPG